MIRIELAGRRALLTGVNSGLGSAIALNLTHSVANSL